ncbi:MAG: hypothetical protein ABWX90_03210, partial [Candidatus Saccharimonadales bacterium]
RGLTLSLPDKTYEFLRMAAPEANRQSTLVMSLTKDSFESLVQGVPSVKASLSAIGGLPVGTYYLTSHSCLPPSKEIK